MNLEHELRALDVAFPPEPELEARVLARLERPRRRRLLAAALAALAAVGSLLAIPQTRAAILELLRIGGVSVERVATQPSAPSRPAALGSRGTFDDVRREVEFPLLAPDAEFESYLDESVPGGMVNLRWDRLLLSQWRGEQLPFVQKQVGPGARLVSMTVRGVPGLWIAGARHGIVYRDESGEIVAKSRRLAGNVPIWERGGVTHRLEGPRTPAQAHAVARDLSPG